MNTLVTSPKSSQPEVLPPRTSPELNTLVHEVRQAAHALRTSSMRLAFYGVRLRYKIEGDGGDWSVLGMELITENGPRIADSEDEFREALGISRSNWYKMLKVGETLSQLSLSDMESLSVANAEILIQVDPKIAQDFPWVQEAKQLSSDAFGLLVTTRNRQSGSTREPTTYFRMKVPVTSKKFLEETVERFRLEHGLATGGEALEMLIADVHDRPNAMTTMRSATQLIRWAMHRIGKRRPESHEYRWLYRAQRILFKTYSAVRMERDDEENAQEVYPAEGIYERKEYAKWSRDLSEQSRWPDGAQSQNDAGVEDSAGHLQSLRDGDEIDRDDDGLEAGS